MVNPARARIVCCSVRARRSRRCGLLNLLARVSLVSASSRSRQRAALQIASLSAPRCCVQPILNNRSFMRPRQIAKAAMIFSRSARNCLKGLLFPVCVTFRLFSMEAWVNGTTLSNLFNRCCLPHGVNLIGQLAGNSLAIFKPRL